MEGKCYNIPEEIMYGRNCFQCFTLLTLESQSLFLCQYLFWVLVTDLLTLKWTGEEPIGYPFIIIGQLANRWGNSRNSAWLYFLGSKITADGDCSREIKRCLFLRRKVMTNLYSIFKSRDITLSTMVCLVKAMLFPMVMYGCESWSIKKAEHWRIDAFELWCWRRL